MIKLQKNGNCILCEAIVNIFTVFYQFRSIVYTLVNGNIRSNRYSTNIKVCPIIDVSHDQYCKYTGIFATAGIALTFTAMVLIVRR